MGMFNWNSTHFTNYCKTSLNVKENLLIKPTVRNNQTHLNNCGLPEVQIERLTIRIKDLSKHLQVHTHDNATKRGLTVIIGKRLGLLRYLKRKDSDKYSEVCASLGIKKFSNVARWAD